jgi:hypothetical protein
MIAIKHCVLYVIAKCVLMGTPFQQLSDMRRTFILGLQYLTLGVYLNYITNYRRP